MICKTCGEEMEGDGYSIAVHCTNIDMSDMTLEPDANPVYCEFTQEKENETD